MRDGIAEARKRGTIRFQGELTHPKILAVWNKSFASNTYQIFEDNDTKKTGREISLEEARELIKDRNIHVTSENPL